MQKWLKIALILLLLAITVGWYLPAQAKLNYAYEFSDVLPIFVWINCDGKPVAFVTSTSIDYLAADVWQANHIMETRVPAMMDEALKHRMLGTIDLSDRPWIECKIND